MANTKVTQHVIANNAITADQLASAAVTDAKLHSTLDLSGKTLTLPATAIPSASTATTQAASDNSTKLATTAYVTTAIGNLNDSAPTALNTLNELAAALGDDANFSATITTSLASKLPLAGGTLTGDLVLSGAPTSGLHPATKTYTDTADALKLNLTGGTLTGDLILNTTTALKIPAGTTGQRPSASTGQIRWNTTDGALEVYNGTAWTAVGTGSSNKVLDTFTGDGSTTTFTLSITPANEDAIMVFIDGAYQEKGDYVLTNNSLALGTAPLSGEKIAVHTTTASVHDGTTALNQAFTGDGSTTDFTLSQDPKSENNTQIYINGVYQQKTDYTVTGTTLAFDTAPDTGDIIEVNMFTVATLGNTDTVNEGVSNLYHTTARARGAISVSGNALSYNSSTGVITSAYEESPSFTGNVTVAGTISSGAITSGSHLINTSSSAFGGSSVQGFNTDFLVDTGQGYSRHNSYHTGGSNHQFLVNAAGSTTNTVALAINKDANATFAGTIASGAITSSSLFTNTYANGNVSAPSTSDHTAGTRQVYYDSSATAWYARGIEGNTLWDNTDADWKLYRQAALRLHWGESAGTFSVNHGTPIVRLADTSSSGAMEMKVDGIAAYVTNKSTNGGLYLQTNNPRDQYVHINGTAFYSESFALNNGVQYDFDIDVGSEGGSGNSFFIIAGYNHFYNTSYGAHKIAFMSARTTNMDTMINVGDQSSTGGGAWQFTKPSSGVLRVRKTAGTYVGGGHGFITVIFKAL